MKPYGIPRNMDLEYPDVAAIKEYGRPTHLGKVARHPGGDVRANQKSKNKQQARRRWKRVARSQGKELCKEFE